MNKQTQTAEKVWERVREMLKDQICTLLNLETLLMSKQLACANWWKTFCMQYLWRIGSNHISSYETIIGVLA